MLSKRADKGEIGSRALGDGNGLALEIGHRLYRRIRTHLNDGRTAPACYIDDFQRHAIGAGKKGRKRRGTGEIGRADLEELQRVVAAARLYPGDLGADILERFLKPALVLYQQGVGRIKSPVQLQLCRKFRRALCQRTASCKRRGKCAGNTELEDMAAGMFGLHLIHLFYGFYVHEG